MKATLNNCVQRVAEGGCARERRASEHQGSKRSGAGDGLVLQQFHGIGPAAECQKRKRRCRVKHDRRNRAAVPRQSRNTSRRLLVGGQQP